MGLIKVFLYERSKGIVYCFWFGELIRCFFNCCGMFVVCDLKWKIFVLFVYGFELDWRRIDVLIFVIE